MPFNPPYTQLKAREPMDGHSSLTTFHNAGALNFKDVLLAYGKLPLAAISDPTIGVEFSGQVFS